MNKLIFTTILILLVTSIVVKTTETRLEEPINLTEAFMSNIDMDEIKAKLEVAREKYNQENPERVLVVVVVAEAMFWIEGTVVEEGTHYLHLKDAKMESDNYISEVKSVRIPYNSIAFISGVTTAIQEKKQEKKQEQEI